jgi:hypothetical protein
MDQTGIISVVAMCVSGIVSISVPLVQLWIGDKNAKKQLIYQAKRDAIIEALNFLDDWLSYLTWHSDGSSTEIPVEKDKICNTQNMTMRARKVLNLLCVYCDFEETVDLFSAILFHKDEKKTDLYIEFREACRKELRLSKISFNKDEVFVAKVSSGELEENKKQQE